MLHAGLRLGDRYRLDARIGAGGMGEVWRAVDEVLGRTVAVKAMLPAVADDPDFGRRFLVEAKAMASVNHPAVASIHDYGRSAGVTFLVMEFIEGESLSQLLAAGGRLAPTHAMGLLAQAADGLQAVHDCGIVHRDIKPANLLIRRNGSLLITDFGISRAFDGTQLTASGAILGTPSYLSPEQVLGQPATGLSDVYALGLTAYECLAGHRPFTGDNPYAMALQRLQSAPHPLGADVPAPVRAIVERALAADPAQRWPSAAALADAARAALGGTPLAYRPPAAVGGAQVPPAGHRPPAAHRPPGTGYPQPAPAGPDIAAPPLPRAARRTRRGAIIAGAALSVVLLGGAALWHFTDLGRGGGPGGGPGDEPSVAAAPAGFGACAEGFCPSTPMCWGGVTSISGDALPPRKRPCTGEHSWETFAATYLPADATELYQDELMGRAEIASVCSASVLAARSADRSATTGWVREAWPMKVEGTGTTVVHCLARPATGDPQGSAFRPS